MLYHLALLFKLHIYFLLQKSCHVYCKEKYDLIARDQDEKETHRSAKIPTETPLIRKQTQTKQHKKHSSQFERGKKNTNPYMKYKSHVDPINGWKLERMLSRQVTTRTYTSL